MTEDQFVQLNRTFREISENEINSDSFDSEFDWTLWGDRDQTDWSHLEQRFRTVILAEGGAGKTREMKERHNILRQEGKTAWFIELEVLAEESIEDLIDRDHQTPDFTVWRDSSREPAWIFLDAVDELKLKNGDFQRALFRLRRSIGAAHDRAHIIISCRPSDWDKIDIQDFSNQLPAPEVLERDSEFDPTQLPHESGEERFLAPLKGNTRMDSKADIEDLPRGASAQPEKLKIFHLRSLTRQQVKQFAVSRAPEIAQEFLESVESQDRWAFARQPQDLLELLELCRNKKGLGTYKMQHEAFLLASLREREGRPGEASQLSQLIAREGAERLSLSLALSKKRTLLNVSEDNQVGCTPASVCPRELLKNWSSSEIKAILRLRIFDPPSYGRIKFHRRDVQEFLAAGRLINLAKAGNDSLGKLCALLFSKGPCDEEILLPTMKGIAVWVASDSSEFGSRVRSKITNIEPELLLVHGDPEHLPIPSKIAILNRIAELNSGSIRRSLTYSAASLKRFAAPQLSQTINRIFESGKTSDSVVCLLLELVKEGRVADCSEMVARVAMTPENSNHWRELAVMGLVACKQSGHLSKIAENILESPHDWPAALLGDIIDEIAPDHLSASQLKTVLEASDCSGDSKLNDFSQSVQRLADKLPRGSEEASELKTELLSMILDNQLPGSSHHRPLSRWAELAPALQVLCLAKGNPAVDLQSKEHFFACLTAVWFEPKRYYGTTKIKDLMDQIIDAGMERKLLFQWEMEYALRFFPSKPSKPLVVHRSLVSDYARDDTQWLEELIQSENTDMRIRLSALLERIRFWNAQGRPQGEEAGLRALGGSGGVLDASLNAYLAQKDKIEEIEEWTAMRRKHKNEEENRLEGWLHWRREILAEPGSSFSDENMVRNRHLIFEWLMADSRKNGSYLVWAGGEGILAAFSDQIKDATASAFLGCWRNEEVKTYSERKDDPSKTPYSWIYALTGVSIESETPGWETRLSDDEVRQATRIAMVEINGLAGYIEQLIHKRPQPVKHVLGEEFKAQWNMRAEAQHLPFLQSVANGSPALKSLMLDVAINLLLEWPPPSERSAEALDRIGHHLSQLIGIIQSCWSEVSQEQRNNLQNQCERTLKEDPKSRFSPEWLRLMFYLDLSSAIKLFEESIEVHPIPARKDAAIRLFANLLSDDYRPSCLALAHADLEPKHLARLILIAFTYINPAEDEERLSGIVYTPKPRDDAMGARSSLVNKLIGMDGAAPDQEIEQLAANPVCASITGYLRSRQRLKAENRADRVYSIAEITEIEDRFESSPRDRDSLFRVMMARLQDLQDVLNTDDFVPLLTLQRIESEEEMQRTIAMMLKNSSNGIYEVFREPEVKGRKRTDIQFCVPGFDLQSVIEIKVGEKPAWDVSALLDSLENQLVNQYLLQRNRKAGCFLITYGGHVSECSKCGKTIKPRRKWKDPDSGKFLDFRGLIERLRIRAKEIVDEHKGEICLEVFGLDLRDPVSRNIVGYPGG